MAAVRREAAPQSTAWRVATAKRGGRGTKPDLGNVFITAKGVAKFVEGVTMDCCSHSVQKISTEAEFAKSSKNVTSTH
jgi:hypothetical protein